MTEPGREVIRIRGLNKRFGSTHAVIDVDLDIRRGEVLALMGANGAGKSTLIKILCGVHPADSGTVEIDGAAVDFRSPLEACAAGIHTVHQIINDGVVQQLTVAENLDIHRRLTGAARSSVAEAIGRLRLDDYADRRAGRLSLGNKQRLSLARALLHAPELLILDEPANGLDPAGIVEVRELLRELAASGVTVLMSSHLLAEVAHLAHRIGIVDAGRLVEEASRHELATRARAYVRDAFTEAERAEALITADLERYFLARTAPSERPVR